MQVIVRTKENAEKKLTLTYEEMEAEREEVLSSILL
jgi:splicing factor 3A subunit 3